MRQKLFLTFALLLMAVTGAWAKDFTGGELYTLEEFQYGKFEARMKMAAASGTVSSMFLYQDGSEIADGRPWVEVDIEILGKNPGSFQSNIITGKAGAQVTSEKHHAVSPAADQAFHTYAIEWTPDYVRWTVDGVEVRKTEKNVNDNNSQVANLTGTQGLRFNLWSSESQSWVGAFDESKIPLFQFINWVKVYRYTPGEGPDGSDFTLDWTDNFNTFDGSRWGKGNWTFDGNRVDLTENNVYCQDGMMILALTHKGEESFNGAVPIDPNDVIASGNCGTSDHESDVKWTLINSGVLIISGTGAMTNYYNSSTVPWNGYIQDITTIVIESGVTSIGKTAFYGCTSLTSVTIPNSVTSIGGSAFDGCTNLSSVTIPNGVASIGSYAFGDCTSLTSVNIPASVTSIGDWAFTGCSAFETITVDGENTKYDSRNNCNAIIETNEDILLYGCKNTVIPDGVTKIGGESFYGCTGLTSIEIPGSVTDIGNNAFYGCTGLTSIEIPASVTTIWSNAFDAYTGDHVYVEVPGDKQLVVTIGGETDPVVIKPTDNQVDILECLFADPADRTTSRALSLAQVVIWYVDGTVPSGGDGKSEETAFQTLKEALDVAEDGNIIMIAAASRSGLITSITYAGEDNVGLNITKNHLTIKTYRDGEAIFDGLNGESKIDKIFCFNTENEAKSINIKGLTFKNAKYAIVFNNDEHGMIDSEIDATFINIGTGQSGSAICAKSAESVDITGRFINNTAGEGLIQIPTVNNLEVHDAVFINNGESNIFAITTGQYYIYDNWFGSTKDNYKTTPAGVDNISMSNWLFLDGTADPEELGIGQSSTITFNLYYVTFESIAKYDGPLNIQLNLSQEQGELDKTTASLGEEITYTAKNPGDGSVTGKFESASYTIGIENYKIPTQIDVEVPPADVKFYVGDELSSGATLTPADAGSLTITSSDETVAIIWEGNIIAVGAGTTTITVSFAGDDTYAAAESKSYELTFNLNEASVSVDKATLDLEVGDSYVLAPTTTPDGLDVTYIPDNSGVVSVDENGVVTALKKGTAKITLQVGGDGVYAEYATIVTVNVSQTESKKFTDETDNSAFIAALDGMTLDVKLAGRTLVGGYWNTLCLPFNLSADQIAASPLAGATIRTLASYSVNGTNVTITFTEDESGMIAGKPYIVRPASDIVEPEFKEVTINKTMADVEVSGATFKGTYQRKYLDAGDTKKLFLKNDNNFYYPEYAAYVDTFRGYIELDDDVPTGGNSKIFVDFGNGEVNAIESVDSGELTVDSWYNLNGVKLNGEPTEKGIYLYNGHKYIIK